MSEKSTESNETFTMTANNSLLTIGKKCIKAPILRVYLPVLKHDYSKFASCRPHLGNRFLSRIIHTHDSNSRFDKNSPTHPFVVSMLEL